MSSEEIGRVGEGSVENTMDVQMCGYINRLVYDYVGKLDRKSQKFYFNPTAASVGG